MNDEAANTLLKTLEEPPSYVVLLLLTDRPGQVLPTIASRCQYVRFDPVPADDARGASSRRRHRPADAALACARLSLGDAERAALLATKAGARAARRRRGLRARARSTRAALAGAARGRAARAPRVAAATSSAARRGARATCPRRSTSGTTTAYDDRIKRAERRARTRTIDHALQLAGLWYRDLACVAAGAPELAHNADRGRAGRGRRRPVRRRRCATAIALVDDTRARLTLNVSEDLALEALAFRLERLLA